MFVEIKSPDGDYKWLINTDNIVFIDIYNKKIAITNERCLVARSSDFDKLINILIQNKEIANA